MKLTFEKWEPERIPSGRKDPPRVTVTVYRNGVVQIPRQAVLALRINLAKGCKLFRDIESRILMLKSAHGRRSVRLGHHRVTSSFRIPKPWTEELLVGKMRKFKAWRDRAGFIVIDLATPVPRGRPRVHRGERTE